MLYTNVCNNTPNHQEQHTGEEAGLLICVSSANGNIPNSDRYSKWICYWDRHWLKNGNITVTGKITKILVELLEISSILLFDKASEDFDNWSVSCTFSLTNIQYANILEFEYSC
jgi:hypothetical protein